MWIARRRLVEDLARWRSAGWVTAEGEAHIRQDLLERRSGASLPTVLGILGVVLLGFAAMSFVAANWQDMPRLVRLAIIFAGLAGAYAAAAGLFARGMENFAHAAILLGIAVFGAGIMLIAQMYHIEGHPPDAVLLWAMGGLAAGILLRSNPALAAATVLFGVWSCWELLGGSVFGIYGREGLRAVHWALLPAAAAVAVGFALNRWWPGVHLVGALLTGWLILQGYLFHGDLGHVVVALTGAAVVLGALYVSRASKGGQGQEALMVDWASAILGYGLIAAFSGLWAMQFFLRQETGALVLLAALTLALLVVVIHQGLMLGHRGAVWLGYVGFSAEIFALYVKTVGSLAGSSLFFLVAGVIVIALAAMAWWLHQAESRHAAETLS